MEVPGGGADEPTRDVSTLTTRGGVAVSPHAFASEAARDVLRSGGNAADAAVAASAVLGMVLPTTCGIGGDVFAIVHRPGDERPDVLNASGRGGSGLDAGAIRAEGHTSMPLRSAWSITAPGCVDGWEALLGRHGTRSLGDLLGAAIRLGFDGFEVAPELSLALERIMPIVAGEGSAPALYPGGGAPQPGEVLRRPRLASVLSDVAERGRDAIYDGEVAESISKATGGRITTADLARRHADWTEPIGIDVFERTLWTVPPNSQGYLTGAAAWLLEHSAAASDPHGPAFHHAAIEAYRSVAWERDDLIADPDHLPTPADALLDPGRLAERLGHLDPDRAAHWPAPNASPGGTAYLCVVDGDGMGVSLIQSNFTGIGSGISAGDTGVWLHNRGGGFSLLPGHPNEAAPGKRPLHTLSPTLWTTRGRLALVLGTRGGHQQPQYLLQAAAALYVAGLDPVAAQTLPRWSMDAFGPGDRSVVFAEARMPENVVVGLRARGHVVRPAPAWPPGWGPVSMIAVDAAGTRRAAADPRVSTAAARGD
jgi:gamma-glutamyltranspeptidase/glutathione hydrolase